jgi:Predicted membrane protein
MFCPRCSAQNSDDTKFCRACGTNLATISLALANPQQLSDAALERVGSIVLAKRRAGISNLIHGTGWAGASTVVGVALGVFSNTNDWIFVWLGLASWMAVWGMIQWSQGINKLLEARSLRHELGLPAAGTIQRGTQLERTEPAALPDTPITSKLADPSSVTDHTTELLNK